MAIELRPGAERGESRYGGWLHSYHTFSFADYVDPAHVHFSVLRVINDDTVQGGGGFPPHPHRDIEIISYVTQGGLAHRDSMGNGSVIRAGEFQRMTAGTGVVHSEYNVSADEAVKFFQIWIVPNQRMLPPSYDQRKFEVSEKQNRLCLVASGNPDDDALHIHQDCRLYLCRLDRGASVVHNLAHGRCAYIQVVEGTLQLNDIDMQAGDGARVHNTDQCRFSATTETEFLLFDLP